jgi:transposase
VLSSKSPTKARENDTGFWGRVSALGGAINTDERFVGGGRIAADRGIGKSTVGKWIQLDNKLSVQAGVSSPSGAPIDFDLLKENERLRQENRVLKEVKEILKKATAFFASQK